MTAEKLPEPILITDPISLQRMAEKLLRVPILAVDTESNSLYAYQERVCLIQFSIPGFDYLVDPLVLDDLTPLAPLFQTPEIETVFHAAEYDLLCMNRDFGFKFNNLFDTMLAARILGHEAIGLGSILQAEFDVHLNKRYQRANWGQRPLPADLLDYARLDTHYLIPLRDRLKADLKRVGLWDLAHEDFKRMSSTGYEHKNNSLGNDNGVNCWRISGSYDLEPQHAAVLHELCLYRDQKARSLDRPLFKVIGDKTLLEIAAQTPSTIDELNQIQGMSEKQIRRHGKQLLRAVQLGLEAQPIYPPRSPRPDNGYLIRLDLLKHWRKQTARKMGVKSDVVMPRDLLYQLAHENPNDQETLDRILKDAPWRLEHFGQQILQVLEEAS